MAGARASAPDGCKAGLDMAPALGRLDGFAAGVRFDPCGVPPTGLASASFLAGLFLP